MSVKNIILDFGGVLLNINYKGPTEEFKRLGIDNFDELYSKASQASLFDDLEIGKITPAQFHDAIRQLSDKPLTDEAIDKAWNSILLDLPRQNVELLIELKKKYRLFLLSNTNEIHIQSFESAIREKYKRDILTDVFEKVYYSSRIGLRKPHVEAFQYVLQHNGLSANETVFIDDTPHHVEGARKAGLRASWLDLKTTTTARLIHEDLGL